MGNGVSRRGRAAAAALLMLGWVGLLWALEAADGTNGPLVREYGIQPRDTGELLHIYPAAFLHFGFNHLSANTLPLLIFGFLAALRGIGRFLAVCFVIITVSGLGIWLFAWENTNTAGASGVVFGLFGYLLARGFVEKDALDITVGITVFLLYGSILWGVLPTNPGISWQGHLFGLIGGVLAAYWLRRGAGPRVPGRRTGTTGPPPGHPG
ncbi:rhomboid family intramembrane serine protease [Streptomyces sodiiphilus]|uniref:Rhomboid family intramembrane serine protease n=1 Tax=Streptomyces sodiiphilus TaxID=226217 RepID=A0ABP5B7R5_9ACTN